MRRCQPVFQIPDGANTYSYYRTKDNRPVCIALIGKRLDRLKLPSIHSMEARALGVDLEVDHLDPIAMVRARPALSEMLDLIEVARFAGALIASPYKRAAMAHVDDLSPTAQAAGCLTTIVYRKNRRIGHNTTAWAFRQSLRRALGQSGPGRVLLLGAGPTGAAVGQALRDLGTEQIAVADLHADRAEALALAVGGTHVTDLKDAAARADGIINATPVGGAYHPGSPISTNLLSPRQWVADVLDDPFDTELIQSARTIGCRVVDGISLAVFRHMRDFHLLTGLAPDKVRMRNAIERLHLAPTVPEAL